MLEASLSSEELTWLWLLLAAYFFLSFLFLYFPRLLHAPKWYKHNPFNLLCASSSVLCISHRGGAYQLPENTIEAFRSSSKFSQMFELDICFTKDRQLVANHDLNLNRICGSNQQIQSLDYSELPPFLEEYKPYGSKESLKTSKNKIPLLEDIFKSFPSMPMNIDLKTPTESAIKELDRLVRKYQREDITIWGVIGEQNEMLHGLNPKVLNFYSTSQFLKINLFCLLGLLPFVSLREGVLEIPLVTEEFKALLFQEEGARWVKYLKFGVYLLLDLLSRLYVPHLRKRGIMTFYWIVNEERDFERAAARGSAGIISDSPSRLASYLKKSQIYFQE